jgi:hypothetical protein
VGLLIVFLLAHMCRQIIARPRSLVLPSDMIEE